MPGRDTQWIIGAVLVAVVAMSTQIAGIRSDIDDLRTDVRADISRLDDRISRLDDRLRAVEVAFGKVDQRLATLERLHLPGPAE